MITATNYAPTRFRGAIRATCSNWPTHAAGVPRDAAARRRCSRVVFGELLGDRREIDLFVDLGPGESVRVDPMATEAVRLELPDFDPTAYGVPAIGVYRDGVRVHSMALPFLEAKPNGSKIVCYFGARLDVLPFLEVWVDFVPGQSWAAWESMITAANPAAGVVQWAAPGEIRLEWLHVEGALVFKSGLKAPAVLMGDGETLGHGAGKAAMGVVGWQPLDDAERDSGYAAGLSGVVAVEVDMQAPVGAGFDLPELGKAFGPPILFANRLLNRERDALEGAAPMALGPAPNSGQTGAQEDQGYAKGGELVEPGNVLPMLFSAFGMARRPCHWLEADGQLLDPARHPDLVFWSGAPHWHPGVSPDRLGLPRLPTSLETAGFSGPDREHWFANRLFVALAATASRVCYRLVEHQAQAFVFGETVRPGWSTSNVGTARGVGWTALVACNLLRLLRPSKIRTDFVDQLERRLRLVVLPQLEALAAAPIAVMHRIPGTDLRSQISPSYPAWWVTWQQSVGAFGLYALAEQPEVRKLDNGEISQRLHRLAFAFALAVVEHAATEDGGDVMKVWDHVGLRADGQRLTTAEMVHGVGARFTGIFRAWASPLAFWVAARNGHERARRHYIALRREVLDTANADLCWFPHMATDDAGRWAAAL